MKYSPYNIIFPQPTGLMWANNSKLKPASSGLCSFSTLVSSFAKPWTRDFSRFGAKRIKRPGS